MKKWPVLALSVGLLIAGLTATEAVAADPAPTNVHISWKDDTFQQVRVTWEEDAPRPNKIVLRHKGKTTQYLPVYLPPEAPNVVDIAAPRVRDYAWTSSADPLEFAVAVGAPEGETSPFAVSEGFDAFTPYPPTLVSTTLSGTSTLQVKWAPAKETDTTPNDPLDRNIPLTYAPYYSLTKDGARMPLGKQGPATQLTFTGPKPSFFFGVVAYNEWGGQFDGAWVSVRPTQLTVKIPAWSVFNGTSKITGTYTPANERRLVVLQARNSSTSPWYVVHGDNFSGGKFEFDLGTAGTRQYRVAIPNTVYYGGGAAYFGGYSAAATSTTQLRPTGYFWYTQIYAGWTNQARLRVGPAVNTTAILQRWNGKTWTTVGSVKVNNGYGVGYIRTTTPGRVAYRYYVPASTYGGLRFAAAYTPTFVNVVIYS
jgi:hypothetical protein